MAARLVEWLENIEQLQKEMESGVFDFTKDGQCSRCGSCCSNFLPVSRKEIKVMKRYVRKNGIQEQKHLYPTTYPMKECTCPFYSDREKKCLVYEVRPAICRDFQCDKPSKHIHADKAMYHGKYAVCDMRKNSMEELTMADREKLIELLMQKGFGKEGATIAAYHLIANGVTVQKWISVTERLPDLITCSAGTAYSEAVNILTSGRKVLTAIWDGTDFIADAEFWEADGEEITHWTPVLLPLPEPREVTTDG